MVLVPPLPIQKQIVSKLDKQMKEIEMMKKEANSEKEAGDEIFQSYLTRIFQKFEKDTKWVDLQDIKVTSIISKGTTPTTYGLDYETSGIPFVRAEDVLGSKVKLDKCQLFISRETNNYIKRSKLIEGDVLITIAGTLGRTGYIGKNEVGANCNQAVCFIRPSNNFNTRYIMYCLQSNYILSKVLKLKVGGAIPNLNLNNISNIKIPDISIKDQDKFICEVENIKEKNDLILKDIHYKFLAISQLQSSILNEVFGKYEIPEEL